MVDSDVDNELLVQDDSGRLAAATIIRCRRLRRRRPGGRGRLPSGNRSVDDRQVLRWIDDDDVVGDDGQRPRTAASVGGEGGGADCRPLSYAGETTFHAPSADNRWRTPATLKNASTTDGSKCVPRPATDERNGLLVRHRIAVDAARSDRVVDVDQRHQPSDDLESPRLADPADSRCRPTSHGACRRSPWPSRGSHRRGTPTSRSARRITSRPWPGCFRISTVSSVVSAPRLFNSAIGHADLADVVQRREAREQVDPIRRQILAVVRVSGELLRDNPGVGLRPSRMAAGFGVPHFGEREQPLDHQTLRRLSVVSGLVGTAGARA